MLDARYTGGFAWDGLRLGLRGSSVGREATYGALLGDLCGSHTWSGESSTTTKVAVEDRFWGQLVAVFCTIRVFCPVRIWDILYAYGMVLLSHTHMDVLYTYGIEIAITFKICNRCKIQQLVDRIESYIATCVSVIMCR